MIDSNSDCVFCGYSGVFNSVLFCGDTVISCVYLRRDSPCHSSCPSPVLNFMLMGMAYSAVFSNMISEEQLKTLMVNFNPILGIAMIIVILNLGAPLDYHAIANAGLYTFIYIVARALGKYFGVVIGSKATKAEKTVQKYLGLTLLPHSGVSLVFTGIAV